MQRNGWNALRKAEVYELSENYYEKLPSTLSMYLPQN